MRTDKLTNGNRPPLKKSRVSDEDENSELVRLVPDAKKRAVFREVMKTLSAAAAEKMSAEKKKERGRRGGHARTKSTTPAERKRIGQKGAEKRWGKKE